MVVVFAAPSLHGLCCPATPSFVLHPLQIDPKPTNSSRLVRIRSFFVQRLNSLILMRCFGLSLVFFVASCWAQLTVQRPEEIYNGQNVSAVDLIGNPHRDMEPLRSKVKQKAGQPYSQEKVQESIEALKATGKFPKVEVNVVPDLAGLRLNFLLEPAYYLGMVTFPGASKNFPYTRLLQVVNLPDEDPFDKARIPPADKALLDFLRHAGYFQASVQSDYEIDDAHQLVNVRFLVALGKQARIGSVRIEGVDNAEKQRLSSTVRSLRARFTGGLLKRGKRYSAGRIHAATSQIQRTLSQQHRLASNVQELPPQYQPGTNRVDVGFKVQLGPTVVVRVTGARLALFHFMSTREIKKLIPIYSEGSVDDDLVQEGEQNLVSFFQQKGFFDVKVRTDLQHQSDQILLTYEIDKGEKHKVARISFRGNHELAEKDLLNQVEIKKSHLWWHGKFSEKLLKQSATNLEALYRDHGFEEVKVASQAIDHEPKVDVLFTIDEGPQTLVDNIEVTGNNSLPRNELTKPAGFQLQPGKPFSPRRLSDDRNRISANYLNRGYLNVEVRPSVKHSPNDPHRVDVLFAVTEHQLVRVGEVIYLGQQRTRLSLIRKTARIPAEAPMERGQLLEAESRLYDLNIFDWSSVGPRKPITDQTEEAALVKVHESKRNEITYGFGFEVSHRGANVPAGTVAVPGGPPLGLGSNQIQSSEAAFASPRGSIEFTRRNIRGLGETASAALLLSRLDQRALLTYLQPHFIGSRWKSLSSFSIERTTENPLFAAGLGDLSFQVERELGPKHNTRLQIRYDFNKTSLSHLLVPELVLPQDRNVHLSTFSGTVFRDTRDKPLDAHHGMFETVNLGITPTSLGSSANFAKLFGQYAFYKPVHSIVFANSVRLGLLKSFDSSFVPTSQLFFSGGGTTLRGFPIDEAGPQRIVPFCNVLKGQTGCVNVTVPVGGRQLFIWNSEARFPLGVMKALGGVVFYDGGNVYSAINLRNFADNYSNTIGVGLRYATPVGPVRFDIGKDLNPVPGIKSIQYFITLGQAF
jgi:outer membrane protein assembly factor BamA